MTTAIFAKTPKGIEEVETKAHGLSRLERSVLIYVDGKRTEEDFKILPRVSAELDNILAMLESGGYITPVGMAASPAAHPAPAVLTNNAPSPVADPVSGVTSTIFRELPATFDPAKFNMAKNFMTNTLNAFKGPYGATTLVRNIDHCQTHEELRALFDQWHEAIANTRQGQKQGKDLQAKLLDVL
ncbi:MAG: hypothetical protein KJ892_04230 [Gammaproteobacteria bacterium]|nr:hypothetical protein [Gammaproteobacteria bacterium]MBU2005598.1 hypothetical protein [Gammaproteobacteria bacterium]